MNSTYLRKTLASIVGLTSIVALATLISVGHDSGNRSLLSFSLKDREAFDSYSEDEAIGSVFTGRLGRRNLSKQATKRLCEMMVDPSLIEYHHRIICNLAVAAPTDCVDLFAHRIREIQCFTWGPDSEQLHSLVSGIACFAAQGNKRAQRMLREMCNISYWKSIDCGDLDRVHHCTWALAWSYWATGEDVRERIAKLKSYAQSVALNIEFGLLNDLDGRREKNVFFVARQITESERRIVRGGFSWNAQKRPEPKEWTEWRANSILDDGEKNCLALQGLAAFRRTYAKLSTEKLDYPELAKELRFTNIGASPTEQILVAQLDKLRAQLKANPIRYKDFLDSSVTTALQWDGATVTFSLDRHPGITIKLVRRGGDWLWIPW